MTSLLDRLLGRKEASSAETARERLKLVLVTDRSDLSPERLSQMQGEIIEVIKRYLQIDEQQVQIKLEQRERKNYLVADVLLERERDINAMMAPPSPEPAADSAPDSVPDAEEPDAPPTPNAETKPKKPRSRNKPDPKNA